MNAPPEITDGMRDEARRQPGGNVYVIDPQYAKDGANGAIPPQGIIGAYPVDEAGNIIPEFIRNPNYKAPLADQ